MKKSLIALCLVSAVVMATPTTQIWNPATDVQAAGTYHIGIDNYANFAGNGSYMGPTDIGLTYGVMPGFEIGIDANVPGSQAFGASAKYGTNESDKMPALAVGVQGIGNLGGTIGMNMIYGLAAKTFPLGRISAGLFSGDAGVLGTDKTGYILTYDKALNDKVWVSVDFSSGNSGYGMLWVGGSYAFSGNTSVLVAIGAPNAGGPAQLTTQLDINI
jgi:hypothetical protein